jgi:hypothetical protein
MLIFGKSTADWKEKAKYAEAKGENEFAKIREVRCENITDAQTAFAAMAAFAADTKCEKFLYHATINLVPGERLTKEQWMKAVDTLEKNLKLIDHYRVVFEHIKKDRQHYHIVWSRIPPEGGAAVNMGNDFSVHQRTAKALEREFGLKPAPRPDKNKPSRKKQERNERNGKIRVDPDIVTREVTLIFRNCETSRKFIKTLAANGYVLTRGKNGSLAVVDKNGGYHGLMRRIEGAKLADLRRKFPALDKMPLPSLSAVLRSHQTPSRKGFKRSAVLLLRVFASKSRAATHPPSLAALIARIRKTLTEEENRFFPFPLLRRRKRKTSQEEPPEFATTRAEVEKNELLAWAWENGRLDILAMCGINLPRDYFEP